MFNECIKRYSSSPDSLSERSGGEARSLQASPGSLHKLAVPLARCEVPEVRDAAVAAAGHINPDALKYVQKHASQFFLRTQTRNSTSKLF